MLKLLYKNLISSNKSSLDVKILRCKTLQIKFCIIKLSPNNTNYLVVIKWNTFIVSEQTHFLFFLDHAIHILDDYQNLWIVYKSQESHNQMNYKNKNPSHIILSVFIYIFVTDECCLMLNRIPLFMFVKPLAVLLSNMLVCFSVFWCCRSLRWNLGRKSERGQKKRSMLHATKLERRRSDRAHYARPQCPRSSVGLVSPHLTRLP